MIYYEWFQQQCAQWMMIYSEWFVGPGISSYEEDPPALRPHLQVCLQEAEGVVPDDKYRSTPVYLGATAGMRLIQYVIDQNSVTERELHFSVKNTILIRTSLNNLKEFLFFFFLEHFIAK